MSSISYSPGNIDQGAAHKLSFSFSPKPNDYQQTIAKSALLQSRRAQLKNRTELFAEEKKENQAKLIQINKSCSQEFVDQLCSEHRIEVQKLLLQISRLHDLVQDLERQNRHQVIRIKQQSQQIALMRISSLRQCQMDQLDAVESQLKTFKKNYHNLQEKYQKLENSTSKQIQELQRENKQQNQTIKKLIEDKNEQVYKQKRKNEKQIEKIILQKEIQMTQIKESMEKQLKKIEAKLQKKDRQLDEVQEKIVVEQSQYSIFQKQKQQEKQQMTQKIQETIRKHKNRQEDMIRKIKQFYEDRAQELQTQKDQNAKLFNMQIDQLARVINLKNSQIQRNSVYYETQKIEFRFMQNYFQQKIKDLKQSLKKQRINHQQESQLLKTKMSILHQNDIQSLTNMYEKRINDLVQIQQNTEQVLKKTQEILIKQKKEFYQRKKKSEFTISKLEEEVLRLKMGMGSMETDMKQKIENQKSMLLFTSKNFIKQVQLKTANNKFYEEQLRKLRHLLDVQANQLEQSQKNVQQKIKLAEDELTRLSNKILQVKAEAEQSEAKYKALIQGKDEQIHRLNSILNMRSEEKEIDKEDNPDLIKIQEELNKALDQLGSYKMRCQEQQDRIKMLKSQAERLNLENQINSEDAKKHYKAISDKNLNDMKNFYDRRIKELELDKKQLQKINSSQTEQITQLIKKYKQAENCLKELVKQSKKRGDLETKIINIGMDTNLIKNMAQLFKK